MRKTHYSTNFTQMKYIHNNKCEVSLITQTQSNKNFVRKTTLVAKLPDWLKFMR